MNEIIHPKWDKVKTRYVASKRPDSFPSPYSPCNVKMRISALYKSAKVNLEITKLLSETEFIAEILDFGSQGTQLEDLTIGQIVFIDRIEIEGVTENN